MRDILLLVVVLFEVLIVPLRMLINLSNCDCAVFSSSSAALTASRAISTEVCPDGATDDGAGVSAACDKTLSIDVRDVGFNDTLTSFISYVGEFTTDGFTFVAPDINELVVLFNTDANALLPPVATGVIELATPVANGDSDVDNTVDPSDTALFVTTDNAFVPVVVAVFDTTDDTAVPLAASAAAFAAVPAAALDAAPAAVSKIGSPDKYIPSCSAIWDSVIPAAWPAFIPCCICIAKKSPVAGFDTASAICCAATSALIVPLLKSDNISDTVLLWVVANSVERALLPPLDNNLLSAGPITYFVTPATAKVVAAEVNPVLKPVPAASLKVCPACNPAWVPLPIPEIPAVAVAIPSDPVAVPAPDKAPPQIAATGDAAKALDPPVIVVAPVARPTPSPIAPPIAPPTAIYDMNPNTLPAPLNIFPAVSSGPI